MKTKPIAVVSLSGGMDSAVCTGLALEMGFEVAALHLNYGQRTQDKELRAFNDLCSFYRIQKKLVVDISYLTSIGGSSLTDHSIAVEKNFHSEVEIPKTYVPFRNANILAIATSWAEVLNANAIFIGAVQEDGSGYPDCRDVFFQAFQQTITTGTKPETVIQILTPLLHLNKKEIVLTGESIGVPFHLTWSCYEHSDKACGECDSCRLRLRGFREASLKDPIEYQ
jgi:7-cyano-7-deazaguanine synthase